MRRWLSLYALSVTSIVIVAFSAVDGLMRRFRREGHGAAVRLLVLLGIAAWTVAIPARHCVTRTRQALIHGIPGYSAKAWHESKLVRYLREHPLGGVVLTNAARRQTAS